MVSTCVTHLVSPFSLSLSLFHGGSLVENSVEIVGASFRCRPLYHRAYFSMEYRYIYLSDADQRLPSRCIHLLPKPRRWFSCNWIYFHGTIQLKFLNSPGFHLISSNCIFLKPVRNQLARNMQKNTLEELSIRRRSDQSSVSKWRIAKYISAAGRSENL